MINYELAKRLKIGPEQSNHTGGCERIVIECVS